MDISVITPTLNAARHLESTIESVRRQQDAGVRVEHIIVDDASTDETVAIARDNGVRVVPGRDEGLYGAMNVGAAAASGSVLNFLGGDDLLLPGAAALALERLRTGAAQWAVGGLEWIDDAGQPLGSLGPPPPWMSVGMFASLGWNCIHHQATFMARELFERLGGYDASFRISGDYELLARALQDHRYARVRRPFACFRRPGTNLSTSPGTGQENDRVVTAYAPAAAWRRQVYGLGLRLWLNGRHPRWLLGKRFPAHATRIATLGRRERTSL
jgi:hypothetical protein